VDDSSKNTDNQQDHHSAETGGHGGERVVRRDGTHSLAHRGNRPTRNTDSPRNSAATPATNAALVSSSPAQESPTASVVSQK